MSKEIYISSTPHETRLAIVENDALTEIYYERENEYTLAGSIYNGKVTRVLPGMQSSFVDIGLERDAFLYITDFMEEAPDSAEFETSSIGNGEGAPREARVPRLEGSAAVAPEGQRGEGQRGEGRGDRGGNDRGERNGRGRRGRSDRNGNGERNGNGDRNGNVERPAAVEVEAPRPVVQSQPESYAEGEVGAGAPGADGSRRWRGRRGRRRGRGAVPGAPVAAEAGQELVVEGAGLIFPAEAESESVEDLTGEMFGEPTTVEARTVEAAVEVEPVSGQPYSDQPRAGREASGQSYNESRRGGQSGGRNGGRDGGRGRDQGRDQGRGRDDRGGRGERSGRGGRDEQPRAPRGFAPSRSLYGVDSTMDENDGPVGEPIILPGESLGKYRKDEGGASAAAGSAAAPAAAPGYTIPTGWDGGATLPGETLSRHRRPEGRGEARSESRTEARHETRHEASLRRDEPREMRPVAQANEHLTTAMRPAPVSQPDATPVDLNLAVVIPPVAAQPVVVQEADGPSVAETPELQPEVALAGHPEQVPVAEIAHEAAVPEPHTEMEYEPEEASASYRVDPIAVSEYRQSAPVAELEEKPEEAVPPAEPAFGQTHFFTPEPGTPVVTSHEATFFAPAETPLHENQHEDVQAEVAGHDVTTLSASGEMVSEPVISAATPAEVDPTSPMAHETAVVEHEVAAQDEPADLLNEHAAVYEESEEAPAGQFFAPGSGELEEELMDDDEFEVSALHASHDEESDDLEEETLEGAADLGTMLREMSIDQITRTTAEPDEDSDLEEEDLEEDFLEESAGLDDGDDDDEDEEGSEEAARTAEATGDFSTEFREPAADATPGEGGSYNERRGGRRDARRGGRDRSSDRDRDARRGSDSSGRARNTGGSGDRERGRSGGGRRTMQATNLPAISDLLKPGQEILVQIAKEPIAKKGARITSHIALPGRFLVFMPTVHHTGVSRKIESDGERRRLKEILLSEKGEAAGGFIVRTAAAGASEEELRSDLRFLLNLWTDIKNRSESSKSPALIYHDLNLVERILRDQVTDNFSAIWVDTETEYERVLRFLQRFQPGLIRRVKLYGKETPLFEQFGITEEINKALRSKVWLKSGGSIVINQTEALVAIDINTGKFVGKTARLEDTIVKTNLDAIPEIVRQIRLRDLGGIIIIDFIDMDERKNRNKVMAALEEELKSDRAPSKVLQFNDFGLVAITRKRVKQSLERTLSSTCAVCQGTGMTKSPVTVCNDIYIEMRKMYKHLDKGDVMLRVHPEVVKQLKSPGTKWLNEMEEMSGKTILVKSDPSLHPEQFDIH